MQDTLSNIDFKNLQSLVYELAGISMGENKRHLLKSRLQRRLRALDIDAFSDYIEKLKATSPGDPEREEFVNAVTTNKTDFFREPHHFQFIVNRVIPELLAKGQNNLRIWHAGCSTGEEPYTMAMTLLDAGLPESFTFKQLASDIDTNVLAHAQAGIYAEERVETVPDAYLRKWFLKGKGPQAGRFRVHPTLQEHLTFRQINLVQQPWPLKSSTLFDVVFCRNVMIYFSRETQAELVARLVDRIRPGGYLMLGHSESLHTLHEVLQSVGPTMYRKQPEDRQKARAA